ncbi:MAG: CBS domain-containing protein [Bacteroidia bacterium]|nr:CBS domain-containing protein [Bacteroidia bacterium]NNF32293.1 CBS domain-containing protein [Flavobacteriaceae bacterium]MBT8276935.1 CBS domain-containing protein [Bacteroidia bacterium]NNJ83284.1 CBS domain-containing protein [Flavobacteriaceae bacterium]NNK53748.1 CBS domain-containing protein [Flavobacteriaceae bacterium]
MDERTPISSIMTREVVTLNNTDTLEMAEHLFKSKKIRHIPIVRGPHVIGILSYTDLLRISFADAFSEDTHEVDTSVYTLFTIEQVMARNLVSVNSNTTIKEVAEIFAVREFHALPVVDDNRLVGIVTTTDLIKFLLAQF